MTDTWIAFAGHGRPDNPAIREWPAYTQAERATMVFDNECRITRDLDRDARLLWTRLVKG
jgi:para-nitrobenzyl esterase